MAVILKVWCHIRNTTLSINVYLLEEQSCQISSQSDLKRRSLRLFFKRSPDNKNKMSRDMRSVPDQIINRMPTSNHWTRFHKQLSNKIRPSDISVVTKHLNVTYRCRRVCWILLRRWSILWAGWRLRLLAPRTLARVAADLCTMCCNDRLCCRFFCVHPVYVQQYNMYYENRTRGKQNKSVNCVFSFRIEYWAIDRNFKSNQSFHHSQKLPLESTLWQPDCGLSCRQGVAFFQYLVGHDSSPMQTSRHSTFLLYTALK